MPLEKPAEYVDSQWFTNSLSAKDIDFLVGEKRATTLNARIPTSVPVKTWKAINDQLLPARPKLELVLFDMDGNEFDLSMLQHLPNLKSLGIRTQVTNLEALSTLPKLRELDLDLKRKIPSFKFLEAVPKQLTSLCFYQTMAKDASLEVLRRFKKLRSLAVSKEQTGHEVIAELPELGALSLDRVNMDLSLLREHNKLWSLAISEGAFSDLTPLKGWNKLKALYLTCLSKVTDLSVISTLTGLQCLELDTLHKVKELPNLSKLQQLRRVRLWMMSGIKDISNLQQAKALTDLHMLDMKKFKTADYAPLFSGKPMLKMADLEVHSSCKAEMEELLKAHKVKDFDPHSFRFRK